MKDFCSMERKAFLISCEWNVPIVLLLIIVAFCFIAAVAAVRSLAKRIRNMEITETINDM